MKELFIPADNDEYSLLIHPDIHDNCEKLLKFIGVLIGKAILENITINFLFNKLIYLLILDINLTFDDLVFVDKSVSFKSIFNLYNNLKLYRSLKNLKEMNNEEISSLELYFEIQYKRKNQLVSEELIINGSKIKVNLKNLKDYIQARLDFIVKQQISSVNLIKNSFYSVIPKEYIIDKFTANQFELILNGRPFIDVEDWEINTIYKGGDYSPNHNTIKYFWKVVKDLHQKQLRKFLQFCTGTSRIPAGGFVALESNRNQISKFCINYIEFQDYYTNLNKINDGYINNIRGFGKFVTNKISNLSSNINTSFNSNNINYDKTKLSIDDNINNKDYCSNTDNINKNILNPRKENRSLTFCVPKSKNFIKAHACFNRIDLPNYNTLEDVKEAIMFIVENDIYGFGID